MLLLYGRYGSFGGSAYFVSFLALKLPRFEIQYGPKKLIPTARKVSVRSSDAMTNTQLARHILYTLLPTVTSAVLASRTVGQLACHKALQGEASTRFAQCMFNDA